MKILVVVPHFVPEIGSASHIYFDLAKGFVKNGNEVDVITSYPRDFNLSKGGSSKVPMEEEIDGIMIHRCDHSSYRDSVTRRGLEHFLMPRYYFKTYRSLKKKFDVCLIYVPPLPLYYFARRLKRFDGTPSVLNYQDFHPQELTDVGLLKNWALIKLMERMEKSTYRNADHITVISEKGVDYVQRRGGDHERISHIYNGIYLPHIIGNPPRKDFKKEQGIEGKTLVTYAGILSPFQGLDLILDAAKRMLNVDDISFYIVGDGMIRDHLAERIEKERITNVRLLPLQPRDEYLNIVGSSDISLVSLDGRMKAPCLPGKFVNLLALGQPIVAIVPPDSESARVVVEGKAGRVVNPSDIDGLVSAIADLMDDPDLRSEYGRNGIEFLKENMDIERCATKYQAIFESMIGATPSARWSTK